MVFVPNVEIVRASAEDASTILDLQLLAYQSEAALYNDWSLPPLQQTLADLIGEFATTVFLKACIEGTLIGSVRAKPCGTGCEIGRLIVHPDHQRRGLGRRLMYAIESLCNSTRYELFTGARSEGNIRLYESLGYRAFRTLAVAPHVTLVYMEKTGLHHPSLIIL